MVVRLIAQQVVHHVSLHLRTKREQTEWIRKKLKDLVSLIGRLGVKAAEVLPGIIGAITSWILNRAADIVGLVSQNLWDLVVGIGGLLYTYMVTK